MSEQSSQEPTMEEILASIRRIISEDEAPAEGGEPAAAPESEAEPAAAEQPSPAPEPAPEPAVAEAAPAPPEPEPEPEPEAEDDDLELTQRVETHGDLDFVEAAPPPEPAPEPVAQRAPEPQPVAATLVSEHVATAAAAAFGRLSANIAMPASDRTLEDVVRELLRPLLQQWLDDNLPAIVQQAVEAEVDRIARARVR